MIVRSNIGGWGLRGYVQNENYIPYGYDGYDPRTGYDGYGVIGCSDLTTALQNLNNTIAAAQQAGVSASDPDYAAAYSYANNPPWFDWSSDTCTNDTNTCNTLYANLTAKVRAAGGTPPAPVAPDSSQSLLSSLNPFSGMGSGGMPTWLVGILVVVGIGGTAWLASSAAKIYVAKKRVAG